MQQPNMVYINKIGGELNFTAEKGLSVGVFCLFYRSLTISPTLSVA